MPKSNHNRNGRPRARKPKAVKLRCRICKSLLKRGFCMNARCPQSCADRNGFNVLL